MILPNKYVTLSESYFGLSALILDVLNSENLPIDKLWDKFDNKYIKHSNINNPPTYQKFIYVLEYMFLTNLISYNEEGEILNENIKFKN